MSYPAQPIYAISAADLQENGGNYVVLGRVALPVINLGGGGGVSDVSDLTTSTGVAGEYVRVAAAGGLEYRTLVQLAADLNVLAPDDINLILHTRVFS